jgi:hypothetical protein
MTRVAVLWMIACALPTRAASQPANGTWTELSTTGPAARWGHAMIYDPVRDRLLVHGGWNTFQYFDDVWEFPLETGGPWQQVTTSGVAPSGRAFHSAIYDPDLDRMVIYGGYHGVAFDEVWALDLGAAVPEWRPITASGTAPAARYWHSAVYDDQAGRMIVFGGANGIAFFADTWELDLRAPAVTWTTLDQDVQTTPEARCCHEAVFARDSSRLLVFGGWNGTAELGDLWELPFLTIPDPGWAFLPTTGSITPRTDHVGVLDLVRNRYVVHGGVNGPARLGDVWELPVSAPYAWDVLAPAGLAPGARSDHAAVYDPVRDRLLLFGGNNGLGGSYGDLWSLAWGANPAVHATCSVDTAFTPGDTLSIRFDIANPFAAPTAYDFTVASARQWPVAQGQGTIDVSSASGHVDWSVPVPDTAALGTNDLVFRVWPRVAPRLVDSCTIHLTRMATPVLVALIEARAIANEVRLAWYVAVGHDELSLYRRSASDSWRRIASIVPDGSGRVAYVDRDVLIGKRYGYRLTRGGPEVALSETWVDVSPIGLALHRAWHRADVLWLEATLPSAASVRVELVDLAGRRVASSSLAVPGGGRQRLAVRCAVPSGVYFARLIHDGKSVAAKVVVTN